MSLIRELRLIPVVLFAAVCLLALKILGFVMDGGIPTGGFEPPVSRGGPAGPSGRQLASADPAAGGSWAKQMFNFPDVTGSVPDKPTGSAPSKPKEEKKDEKPKPADPEPSPGGLVVPILQPPIPPGERAMLERLQERRQELEARARELEVRESMLRSAEKQLELRINELKELEERIKVATQQKDEAEAQRFKSLVTMYENMRAKDAAKIFDRLEMKVLLDVATQINPRRMSDIMALMQPEAAEKLTVELAHRASASVRTPSPSELPKIEGRTRTQ
ncbi:flagellar protein FlbB [Rhodoplanes sp. TEM]|uniref:Flagellar protein FlbB n=1 Tax=Rhodoplanes tepidamans TaxID=200616 RepID=A0ABT5J7B7_RHOTP|nr:MULTISPECIES: flagellar protein FlbB [Rhodoplanes]MDC7785544.1 flagellar protein FlbB [Rhodoplanes tepidamans]MDC7986174.1 flagellar protein FlbB [Rhodoplanes sp. TEM]MDQ0353286.1 flagellar motility protein MotE (MotC chaperone) [Rhodoplanes tepidamans]